MWQFSLKLRKIGLWSLAVLSAVAVVAIALTLWRWKNVPSLEMENNAPPDVFTQEDLISQQSTELDRMTEEEMLNLSEEEMDRQYRELDARRGMIVE